MKPLQYKFLRWNHRKYWKDVKNNFHSKLVVVKFKYLNVDVQEVLWSLPSSMESCKKGSMYFVLSIPEHYHRIITQPCNLLYYLSSAYILILGIHCPDPDLTLSDIRLLHYLTREMALITCSSMNTIDK